MITSQSRRYLSYVGKFVLAFAILAWLIKNGKIDFSALQSVMKPGPIVLILFIMGLGYFAVTLRWRWLLQSRGINIGIFRTCQLTLISLFFSFALPGGVSGDLVKGYYITRAEEDRRWLAGVSIIIDRYIGMTAIILLAFFVMVLDYDHITADTKLTNIFYLVCAMMAGLIVFTYFLLSRRGYNSRPMQTLLKKLEPYQKISQFFKVGHQFGDNKVLLLKTIFLSFAGHLTSVLLFLYMGRLIGAPVNWTAYFYCVPIGFFLMAMPIAPGGVGVGQAGFYFLFNAYSGQVSDLGSTLVTIYQMFSITFGLVGALFYLQFKTEVADANTRS